MIYKSANCVRAGTLVLDADDVFADERLESVFDAPIDVAELDLRGALVRFDACAWPMKNANTFITDANTVLQFPDTNRKLDGAVMVP